MRLLVRVMLVCAAVCLPSRNGGAAPVAQVSEAVIDAPPAEVWKIFATPEGFKAMGVAQCEMDFRIGGLIRTHYTPAPKGVLGDEGSIENEILAYEPERMLTIRIHKPPKAFPFPNSWQGTWTVITLDDAGVGRTRLRLAGLGYRDDEESTKMRAFFQSGNDWTLARLKKHFARAGEDAPASRAAAGAPAAPDPVAVLARLAGSDFIAELPPPPGAPSSEVPSILARTRWEHAPSKGFLVGHGWLGDARGLRPHGMLIVGPDPGIDGAPVRLWNFGDRGDITRGSAGAVRAVFAAPPRPRRGGCVRNRPARAW